MCHHFPESRLFIRLTIKGRRRPLPRLRRLIRFLIFFLVETGVGAHALGQSFAHLVEKPLEIEAAVDVWLVFLGDILRRIIQTAVVVDLSHELIEADRKVQVPERPTENYVSHPGG